MRGSALLILGMGLSLVACGDKDDTDTAAEADTDTDTDSDTDTDTDSDTDTDTDTDTDAAQAMIRVAHLSPDAPAVDVYANEAVELFSNASFPGGTAYLSVDAATYSVQLVGTGGDVTVDGIEVFSALPLEADTMYTAIAHGYFDAGAADANNGNGFVVTPVVDSKDGLEAGNFRVQAVHAAANAAFAQVDVWALDGNGDPASALIPDFDYAAVGSVDLPAGAYSICLDIDDNATCDASFDLPELPADILVNLYAVNDAAGAPFLIAHLEDGSAVRIDPNQAPPR